MGSKDEKNNKRKNRKKMVEKKRLENCKDGSGGGDIQE